MDLLHPVDWVIVAVMVMGTLAIGIYHAYTRRKNETTSEYLTGDHKLMALPVSVSLNATIFSAILVIGIPAENYIFGGIFWLFFLGHSLGAILGAIIFVPVFHPLKLTSVNEYLKMRYQSRFVSILGTLSGVTEMCLQNAIVFFSPATAIALVSGFPTQASIFIWTVITIIYTTIGGIRGVIWTDVFQAALMFIGLITITITGAVKLGGISEVWEECAKWGRLNFDSIDPDPTVRLTIWSLSIGFSTLGLVRAGTLQGTVQRYSSVPTLKKARLAVLSIIPWTVVAMSLAALSGLSVFAFYSRIGCDPLKARFIRNPNQLISRFFLDALDYPGVHGLLIASILAASLSSASSNMNACAANIWKDVLLVIWPNLPEKRNVLITKILVAKAGVVSMCLGFVASAIGGTVIQMAVTFASACGGPTMSMFLLGVFFPFVNWKGVSFGGLCGFIYALWSGFGGYLINTSARLPSPSANCSYYAENYLSIVRPNTTAAPPTTSMMMTTAGIVEGDGLDPNLKRFYSLSYLWLAFFSALVTIATGIIVSLLTGGLRNQIPKTMLHPWIRRFCGVDDDDVSVKEYKGDDVLKEKIGNGQPTTAEKGSYGVDNQVFVTHF